MDAGNILKPALARGELQLVGATTLNEYRIIEKDAALERRFQPVMVDEPTEAESIEILKGLRSRYEEHHKVTIQDEALVAAVRLSARYINDRFLPDKAIDLVDEISRIGTRIAISDAGAGATLLSAALKAVSLNIFINAKSMADREYAEDLLSHTQEMLDEGCKKADDAYVRVERGIRWPSR